MNKTILKNRLKEERINLGLSQKDFAELVGVSRQTINSIENEQFYPTRKPAAREFSCSRAISVLWKVAAVSSGRSR